MGKFFISLGLAAAVIWGLTVWGASEGLFSKPSYFIHSLIFLVFSTGVIYVYLHQTVKPDVFVSLYLLTMVLKLIAYCVYNLVIIMHDKQAAVANVGFFMTTYFIFTGIEVAFLHRKISGENQP